MLAWLKGRRRPDLDAEIVVEEVGDDTFYHPGFDTRFKGTLDEAVALDAQQALDILSQSPIDTDAIIAALEVQLKEALQLLAWQGATIAAAREFVDLIGSTSAKTGEPVFKTTQDDDTLAAQALNHRFVDLAALLNQGTRPVPPKLAKGTVH